MMDTPTEHYSAFVPPPGCKAVFVHGGSTATRKPRGLVLRCGPRPLSARLATVRGTTTAAHRHPTTQVVHDGPTDWIARVSSACDRSLASAGAATALLQGYLDQPVA
jgi:hypothetical protein